MTAYATRSPLQLLTNTYYMMAEQPSSNRRSSARLKIKEDVFAAGEPEKSKPNGATKQTKSSAKASGTTRSKRKIDYDEEDNGFKFTRAQPKRSKATPAISQQQQVEVLKDKPISPHQANRKSQETEEEPPVEQQEVATRNTTRRTRPEQTEKSATSPVSKAHATRTSPRKKATVDQRQHEAADRPSPPAQTAHDEPTKIALPFADTPIIRRNKEMRKGNNESRRSSLSMRGRRASSLIDSGTSSALPHDQVETADFYRHIGSSLPEPRRMRQLLMWCGARAIGQKPSFATTEDSDIKLAAWQIQQELLKDFAAKSELSDWFSREDSPARPKPLKPNPRNIANLAKIEELERKLRELKAEQEQWKSLQQAPSPGSLSLSPLPPIENLSLSSLPRTTITQYPALQTLISSENASSTEFTSSIDQRLSTVKTDFELNLDKLLDSVNSIGQHLSAAEAASKRVLGSVAKVLDEKDRLAVEKEGGVGTMDALRALTRVIDQG